MPSEFSKGPRNIFRNIFVYIFHLSSKGKRLACLLKKNSVKLNCVRISSTHSFFYYLYKNNLFLFASKSSENTILFKLQYQNWGLWEFVTANYSICKVKAICQNGFLILYSITQEALPSPSRFPVRTQSALGCYQLGSNPGPFSQNFCESVQHPHQHLSA